MCQQELWWLPLLLWFPTGAIASRKLFWYIGNIIDVWEIRNLTFRTDNLTSDSPWYVSRSCRYSWHWNRDPTEILVLLGIAFPSFFVSSSQTAKQKPNSFHGFTMHAVVWQEYRFHVQNKTMQYTRECSTTVSLHTSTGKLDRQWLVSHNFRFMFMDLLKHIITLSKTQNRSEFGGLSLWEGCKSPNKLQVRNYCTSESARGLCTSQQSDTS